MLRTVILAALLTAGCKRASDGASCGTVAGTFFKIASDALAADKTLDDATRRQVHDQLPAMRDALDATCTSDTWARDVRDCIATAIDRTAIEKCEERLTPAQRSTLDKSTRGEVSSP